jgi:hypothetical protein
VQISAISGAVKAVAHGLHAAGNRCRLRWVWLVPFPRLHLARGGTIEDLRASVRAAEQTADDLLRAAVEVAGEFLDGRHLFQQDLALRGLLSTGYGGKDLPSEWAMTARQELARWPGLDGDEIAQRRARASMQAALERARELGITRTDREAPGPLPEGFSRRCPLPAPGGPVPGPGRGPGNSGDSSGHPFERPRRPGPVQSEPKGHLQRRRGPAVITSHPGIVA